MRCAMALHADRQGFDTPQDQPRIERARNSPGGILVKGDRLKQVSAAGDRAANDVGVPRKVFGRAVNYQVGAELDRPLQVGGGKRIIHSQQGTPIMRKRGERGDINDLEQRVGRSFDPEELGVRAQDPRESVGSSRLRYSEGQVPRA